LGEPIGFYTVQAAIAACHAQARIPEDTDWRRIASLYDLLAELAPNPVVEVNRALAHGRAYGPDAGLTILAQLDNDSTLSGSHLVPGVRGDLLALAGRSAEAVPSSAALRRSLETSGNGTSCSGEQSC